METIKKWENRLSLCPSVGDVQNAMKAEIADLRAALAKQAEAAPDYSPLFTRIDEAIENYVRHGAICEFEGQPMIYAATLLEIGNLLGEVTPNKGD